MDKRTRQLNCGFLATVLGALGVSDWPAFSEPPQSPFVLYVDDDAPPGGDGASWATAFCFLQDALAYAARPSSGVTEVRIAQGTYKPDQGQGHVPGNRSETFQIPPTIALRGGYAGLMGVDPDARDSLRFETILSGDLLGNDGALGTWQNYTENSLHVATLLNGQSSSLVEGVTFYGSNHDFNTENNGGGLLCIGGTPTITHCQFRGNSAYRGGISMVSNSHAHLSECSFFRNRACYGGAIGIGSGFGDQSKAFLSHCLFEGNSTLCGTGSGSAIAGPCEIVDCRFVNNAGFQASVGTVIGGPDTVVIRCSFQGNYADDGAGVVGNVNCTESLFFQNSADYAGAYRGSGTNIRCQFVQNAASQEGGAFWHGGFAPPGTIIDSIFDRNIALNLQGGAISGHGNFINCAFLRNDCWMFGGSAIYANGQANIVNCLVAANSADFPGSSGAGAIRVRQGVAASIVNSTIVGNLHPDSSAGVFVDGGLSMQNSIVWNNSGPQIAGAGAIDTRYSCIQGGWPGEGIIASDPLFTAPQRDDYRLGGSSPCIDAADNTAVPQDTFDLNRNGDTTEALPIDLLGQRRFRNDPHVPDAGAPGLGQPPVDMGAMEFQLPEDINQSGVVNVNDLLAVINAWGPCAHRKGCAADVAPYPDGDGVVDLHDLLNVILSWGY